MKSIMATKARLDITDTGESEMEKGKEFAVYEKALQDLVKFGEDNPEKVEEFFARLKEIHEQMKQDFEAIRNGTYKPKGVVR